MKKDEPEIILRALKGKKVFKGDSGTLRKGDF